MLSSACWKALSEADSLPKAAVVVHMVGGWCLVTVHTGYCAHRLLCTLVTLHTW